jgi:hypothetical protein
MSSRLLPVAVLVVGIGLAILAAAALFERAFVAGGVIGVVAAVHLVIAAGLDRRSTTAAVAGGVLALVEIAAVAFGLWFILGIELGIGLDLGAAWFAPLNGYATVAAAGFIVAVDVALLRRAVLAVRAQAAVAILA